MRVYRKQINCLLNFCMILALITPGTGFGEVPYLQTGFNISDIATHTKGNVIYLNMDIDYQFSDVVLEAVNNGVPLSIILQIRLIEKRNLLWDKTLVEIEQVFRLQYHALTRQYLLKNISSGTQQNFNTLQLTLASLGNIVDMILINNGYIDKDNHYYIHIKPYIDIESLPSPLRPVAYITADWQFTGNWYIWPLKN